MSLMKTLFSRRQAKSRPRDLDPRESLPPVSQDTQAAIAELSKVVRNNPDAVEIYLALGNLYRSRGEIERAVQIRQNLIVRPGLNPDVAARTWYELGKDFKRGGFLDRALHAFEESRKLGGGTSGILRELALLWADSGEWEQAARAYGQLGNRIAQAHYMVRLARDLDQGDAGTGFKWIKKALKAYPGALEAWLELMTLDMAADAWGDLARHLGKALDAVEPDLRFVLLEGLLDACKRRDAGAHCVLTTDKPFQVQPPRELCDAVLPVLSDREPDLLLLYYSAWMLCSHDPVEARRLLEKTLVLQPEFWPARLELLALDRIGQTLTKPFNTQLEFFVLRAREVKRFVCRRCGMKREQVFFQCPRCRSWHSIKYRVTFNE
ncbi:tetratricopeptide repeat protein [Desulfocurvus sp. DL9XJH121]